MLCPFLAAVALPSRLRDELSLLPVGLSVLQSAWALSVKAQAGYPFPVFSLFLPSPSSPTVGRLPSGDRAWWRPAAREEWRSGVRGARRRWPTVVKGPSWVRSS
ncbi:hypothetical protein Taro_001474 [Colocasia esculenta]|uniref:Uncharacterized protein n=1 Tax=Colocasia esculenta TaxID=4460 RepID=A0A843TKP7_COLES|nr:hypothetical protein [Colocasia esculenta]